MGSSGVDVSQVGWGIRGGPQAVLLQHLLVGFGVKVCPPHQHLGDRGTSTTSMILDRFSTTESDNVTLKLQAIESMGNTGSMCSHETPT